MPEKRKYRLGVKWRNRLGTQYDNWIVHDCGGNGDCLFASLGSALGVSARQIRTCIAEEINAENWKHILSMYKLQKSNGELEDDWDPDSITSLQELKDIIKTPKVVWGDHILVCLAQKALQMNIFLLERQRGQPSCIYNHMDFDKSRELNVFLDYLKDRQHFRLSGHTKKESNDVVYCFMNRGIPKKMKEIIVTDLGLII